MEMEYCAPLGIPHSEFLSWPEADQDKAVSWMLYKNSLCPRCGTDPTEWIDHDGEDVEPAPFQARTRRCVGCAVVNDIESDIKGRPGISVYFERNSNEPSNHGGNQD